VYIKNTDQNTIRIKNKTKFKIERLIERILSK